MNIQDLISNYQFGEHLLLWLAVAFLTGLLCGMLWGRAIGRAGASRGAGRSPGAHTADALTAAVVSGKVVVPVAATSTVPAAARLDNLVGIQDNHINKLVSLGVESLDDLLKVAEDTGQLEALADELQLEDFVIKKWVRMAEFLSIPQLSPEIAEFLVFAGVNSVADLAERNPESLAHKLQNLNEKEQRIAAAPSRQQIEDWLSHLQTS